MNNKDQYINEAIKYFKNKLNDNNKNQYDLYWFTLKTNIDWLRQTPYQDRRELLQDLTRSTYNKIDRHLIKNLNRPCNAHKRLDARTVIESKDRYGNPTDHHSHAIIAVHSTLSSKFDQSLFARVIEKGSFNGVPLSKVMHSMDCKRIDVSHDLWHQWDRDLASTLDYMFKHARDQRNHDAMTPWSYF